EAPVGFDLDAFKVVQNDGKWTLTPPAADGSADDINRWVDEWRLANATGIQPASNGKPLSNVRVKLKNGSDINIGILQREPQLVLVLTNGHLARLRDPRRFALVLWHVGTPFEHKLLRHLGPEPLSGALTPQWLFDQTRGRSGAIKTALMDSHLIAGVGNIYANEALFRARINPKLPARRIGLARYAILVDKIRETLTEAIEAGGSTLRDYVNS